MTLAPPTTVYPGHCSCDPAGCVCAPENLGELMTQMSIARYHRYDALDRGDHAVAARHHAEQQRLSALIQNGITPRPHPHPQPAPPAGDTMNRKPEYETLIFDGTRETLIRAIEELQDKLQIRQDSSENLHSASNAYLVARYRSLQEWLNRNASARTDAVTRADAVSARAALRFDAVPTDREIMSARARVFHSGVPEAEREAVAMRLATHTAWLRARDQLVGDAVQSRMDSLGADQAPTEADRAAAARELPPPLGVSRADAYAAAEHERAIDARARAIAGRRLAQEHRARILATLPSPPPLPRLPQQRLPNAAPEQAQPLNPWAWNPKNKR